MENNAIPVELKQLKTILQKYIVPLAIPGTILLLRGQLGAGKTTLLNHLSGRLASANLIFGGVVKLNGQDVKTLE